MDYKLRPIIVTDLETSGLEPSIHEILEIGAVKVDHNLKELDRFETKVVMQYPLRASKEALAVNGYKVENWKDAAPIHLAVLNYSQFAAEGMLTAWNITFEYGFLEAAFARTGVKNLMDYHRIDVPSIAWYELTGLTKLSMDAAAEFLGLPPEPKPHRAITGALRALEILHELKKIKAGIL